jgi:nucleotide-binding universal stress UspA family protein
LDSGIKQGVITMGGKIAVPLDGSPLAEKALPFAIKLANLTGVQLLLLRVTVFPVELEEAYTKDKPGELLPMAYLERVMAAITNPTEYFRLEPDRVEVKVGRGKFTYEIPEIAQAEGADLIVMTTHGLGGFTRLLLGSVTQQILRNSKLPVIVLRSNLAKEQIAPISEPIGFGQQPITIAVPLDGDPVSEAVLEPACRLAGKLKANITLLRVVKNVQPILLDEPVMEILYSQEDQSEDLRYRMDEARRYLRQLKENLAGYWKEITFEAEVLPGNPPEKLVEWSSQARPLLMALATHARGGVGHILLGSVADEVMREVACPVMMVHINKEYQGWARTALVGQTMP